MKNQFIPYTAPLAGRPATVSFLMVLVLFLIRLLLFRTFYLVNDDWFALFIMKGIGFSTRPDEHLLFNNSLLGLLWKTLYTRAPDIGWYPLFLLLSQFLSFWAFLWATLLRSGSLSPLLPFSIFFIFIGPFYSVLMNYTMTSILAFLGGAFLWDAMAGTDPKGRNRTAILLFSTCFWFSLLIRQEAFFFSGLLALPFLSRPLLRGRDRGSLARISLPVVLLALFSLAFNALSYRRDPAWDQFSREYFPSSEFQVDQSVDYNDRTKPFFDGAGWTKNDADLFFNWYNLGDKYGPGAIQKLQSHFGYFRKEGFSFFAPLFREKNSQGALLCFLAFFFLCPKKDSGFLALNAAWTFLILLFMCYFARAPERLAVPAFCFPAFLSLYFLPPAPGDHQPGPSWVQSPLLRVALLAALLLAAIPAALSYIRLNHRQIEGSRQIMDELTALKPTTNQLFVVWGSSFPYESVYAFDDSRFYRNLRLFSLGPFERSPIAKKMLDHFQVRDLFLDMVDRPDLFLICDGKQGALYLEHMREKYGKRVYAERYFECPLFKVFRIHSSLPGTP